ncbi:hypothetical protein BD408DRAFT_442172 [Parasitella parasitica]|nr:hypothetical protein BD408DRAFT_442172 [Parasitella parasitica]
MHSIRLKWWWVLCLFIMPKKIESLDFSDFGLPNQSNCAFAVEETLYIMGRTKNISIIFDSNDLYANPPKIIAQQQQQQQQSQQISRHATTDPACIITRSGKVILVLQERPLQIVDAISPNLTVVAETNITFQGDQAAIDKFITQSTFLTDYTFTSFNDYLLVQGGRDANQTESQQTYILDLGHPAFGIWHGLKTTPSTPPPSSVSNSVLYATSRWILHFRTQANHGQYVTFVDCFDPYAFLWLGTVASFNTTTQSIKAIAAATTTAESDSLIIVPSLSSTSPFATQSFHDSETATNTPTKKVTFWKLDVSKQIYNNITISPIIINNVNSKTRDANQTSNVFNPVLGGTVTLVAADLAVFYGGATATDQQENLLFFNTTDFRFLPQPPWLTNNAAATMQGNTSSSNSLAVILGSIMGSILFIALVALFIWCCIRRKRSSDQLRHEQYPDKMKKRLFFSVSRDAIDSESHNMAETSSNIPYVLSPIKCISPIDLFPASKQSTSPQIKPSPPRLIKSRFIEHFDYNSIPLVRSDNTENNGLMDNVASSSSLPNLKAAPGTTTIDGLSQNQLSRSASSCV